MTKFRHHLRRVERKQFAYLNQPKTIRLQNAERINDFRQDVWGEFIRSISQDDIRLYPESDLLYQKIGNIYDISTSKILIGAGSDQIIRCVIETFVEPDTCVITSDPCFAMFEVYSIIYQGKLVKIPYYGYYIDIDMIIDSINNETNLVIISNPNSPVGDAITEEKIISLCRVAAKYDVTVVIDEAYIEFSQYRSVIPLINQFSNLVVLRTFSKAWGSAGVRCGYAVSSVENIELMKKTVPMVDLSALTIKWISCILDHDWLMYDYVKEVKENKQWALNHFGYNHEVHDTDCNWIYVNMRHIGKSQFTNYSFCYLNPDYAYRFSTLPWRKEDEEWIRLCIPTNLQLLQNMIILK